MWHKLTNPHNSFFFFLVCTEYIIDWNMTPVYSSRITNGKLLMYWKLLSMIDVLNDQLKLAVIHSILMFPPVSWSLRHCVSGCPSVCLSFHTYAYILHVNGHCWKGFQDQWWTVKAMTRPINLQCQRQTFRWCGVEAHLFIVLFGLT